jgi:hypothetical protein
VAVSSRSEEEHRSPSGEGPEWRVRLADPAHHGAAASGAGLPGVVAGIGL